MFFSIVTVARNHLSGLKKTAASLAHENPELFEWIIIDGASTDGTVEYLETIIPLTLRTCGAPPSPPKKQIVGEGWGEGGDNFEKHINWISEPDTGIYDAMNKGIERAIGDYVLFLNAGDTLAVPRTLDTLAGFLAARPVQPDLIYGDAFETSPLNCHPGESRDRVGTNKNAIPASAGMTGIIIKTARPHDTITQGLFTHHQSIIYRRDIINDLRYDQQYNIAADYKFTAQFLNMSKDILYWPRPICLFESGGISQRKALKGRMQQSLIRRELQMTRPLQELAILAQQTVAHTLRRYAPSLYWRLRATMT